MLSSQPCRSSAATAAHDPTGRAAGPVGGPHVLGRTRIVEPGQDRASLDDVTDLFARVLSANPDYLPGVAAGTVRFADWYRRKAPQWSRLAYTPAAGPDPVGHIGVRLNGCLPDGRLLEQTGAPRLSWELGMLVVAPGVRGCGIATELVHSATSTFATALWVTAHADSPGHRLLACLGWTEQATFFWPGDPTPGLVLTSQP